MSIRQQIENAIGSHAQWKANLRSAIESGESEFTPQQVKADNNCAFGQWLHHHIDATHKASSKYREILSLHANFHKEAGIILELALAGKKEEANARMNIGGKFAAYSETLIRKMKEWQDTF